MKLISINQTNIEPIIPLVQLFRKTLNSYKGIDSTPSKESSLEELQEYLSLNYPIYGVVDGEEYVGYMVCRVEKPCLWLEQIYVKEDHRRQGIASLLFDKAEEISKSMGEDTIFNYVHPNNEGMIQFLRSKGYTVLNLIEIRKPYKDEQFTTTIKVDQNDFDY